MMKIMKVYEVGGAVRDALLGKTIKERDWVVVGATATELLAQGYRPVGKDFPVFLHPRSGEQYALARTERKVAPGYTGFEFDTSVDVTLAEDLARRDLTINAMAKSPEGEIVDPWGGRRDLDNRILRHVSPAFREDPLRVLRVARFAARFTSLGFTIAPETRELMREIVASGEIEALRPERVWQETLKALQEDRPDVYFEVLRDTGALARTFPEVEALFGVPQPERWHPEIDTGVHTLMALRTAAEITASDVVRFAVLTHDLGKATTPRMLLPKHHGHETRSVEIIEALCERFPVSNRFRELAILVARHHGVAHRAAELKASTIVKLILDLDGIRQPDRFEEFLLACEADARGRKGLEQRSYPQADRLRSALLAARAIDAARLRAELNVEGAALGKAIHAERVKAVRAALAEDQRL